MKPDRFTSGVFVIVVMGMMIAAFGSLASNKIFSPKNDEPEKIVIDWEQLYPFPDSEKHTASVNEPGEIDCLKDMLEDYTSKKLRGYYRIVEAARKYEGVIGWNMVSIFDYNPIMILRDGYLTEYTISLDVAPDAENMKGLADFCAEKGMPFFYVNIPMKICISDDSDISGVLDFANQNSDRLLALLKESGVKYYDFRTRLHESGMRHHESFFRTDHHWKPETGLWGAGEVLKILRDDFGWDVEPGIIAPENFEYVIYRDWFLGSEGKKLTLSRVKPEDFTMIYPKFETNLHYEIPKVVDIPGLAVNLSGDFGVIYDMSRVVPKDYYGKNPYAAYIYADNPLERFVNMLAENDRKLLIIHASFGNSLVPFAALGVRELYSIDLRHFTGSVRNFIDKEKPDAVIVMYNSEVPGIGQDPDATETAKKLYDFR